MKIASTALIIGLMAIIATIGAPIGEQAAAGRQPIFGLLHGAPSPSDSCLALGCSPLPLHLLLPILTRAGVSARRSLKQTAIATSSAQATAVNGSSASAQSGAKVNPVCNSVL